MRSPGEGGERESGPRTILGLGSALGRFPGAKRRDWPGTASLRRPRPRGYDRRVATYKQPRRINAVSVTLAVLVLAAAYVGYRAWHVVSLHADVKNVMEEALPRLYRANLLPDPECNIAAEEVRANLVEKLTALGIGEPEKALTLSRDPQEVAITVRIVSTMELPAIGRRFPVTLAPRVHTSAARVVY